MMSNSIEASTPSTPSFDSKLTEPFGIETSQQNNNNKPKETTKIINDTPTKSMKFDFDMILTNEIDPECDILKYPNRFMRIFGLHHTKHDNIGWKVYALTLCIIDWSNFLRFFTTYEKYETFSAELVLKLVTHIWFFICSFLATIIYINQELHTRQATLMKNLVWMLNSKEALCNKKRLRIIIYIIYSITFFFAVMNFSATLISFFGPKILFNGFRLFLAPFHDADWAAESIPFKLIILILTGVTSFHWCLTAAVYLSHAAILIEFLRLYNEQFKLFVKTSVLVSSDYDRLEKTIPINIEGNIFIDAKEKICVCERKLEKFRVFHLKLSYMVQLLDRCYREFIAVNVLFYTVSVLLLIYIMTDWQGNCVSGIMAVLYPFWAIVSGCFLLVVVIFAAIIHSLVNFNLFLIKINN